MQDAAMEMAAELRGEVSPLEFAGGYRLGAPYERYTQPGPAKEAIPNPWGQLPLSCCSCCCLTGAAAAAATTPAAAAA